MFVVLDVTDISDKINHSHRYTYFRLFICSNELFLLFLLLVSFIAYLLACVSCVRVGKWGCGAACVRAFVCVCAARACVDGGGGWKEVVCERDRADLCMCARVLD